MGQTAILVHMEQNLRVWNKPIVKKLFLESTVTQGKGQN